MHGSPRSACSALSPGVWTLTVALGRGLAAAGATPAKGLHRRAAGSPAMLGEARQRRWVRVGAGELA